jgi:glycosyltransferase involved in cell wall biosynthesis
MSRASVRSAMSLPWLGPRDLDLQPSRWHAMQSVRARRVVDRALAEEIPDVLHVHSHTVAFLLGGIMRRVPTVLSMDATVWDWHQMAIWSTPRRHSRLALGPSLLAERRVLRRAAATMAWSEWTLHAARRAAPGARILELHPGLDLDAFTPAVRAPRERPRVLFVGGRFVEKGGEDLLAALGDRLGRDVDLDVVTPAEVAESPGLTRHALRPGAPLLTELYQQADLLCLPTRGDSNPWVLLEAMACGTPVISTTIAAIPELVGPGEAGVTVAPGDVPALREALVSLLGDEDRRRAMGEAARRRVEARYDARVQTGRLLDVMREIATGRG